MVLNTKLLSGSNLIGWVLYSPLLKARDRELTDPSVPDQIKQLAQLRSRKLVKLLERNTVTSPDTLKKIESCLQMNPMAEIPKSTQHTFDSLPKELKDMVLEELETTELLIVAQVSKECTALVKKIVEERQKKRNEWVKFGRNIRDASRAGGDPPRKPFQPEVRSQTEFGWC